MRDHCHEPGLKAGVLALLLVAAVAAVAPAEEAETPPCADCHDEVAAAFARTPHGLSSKAVSCVSCHSGGAQHVEAGGDASLIGTPAGAAGATVCASCHGSSLHRGWGGATPAHAEGGVHCTDCHGVHQAAARPRALLRQEPEALCASCHPAEVGDFMRPYGHRLDRAGLQCVSCHDPHAGSGTDSLRVDRSGDGPCVSCHAEKRGPFVFPHPGDGAGDGADGCLRCHQAHGSSNPMQLTRARVDQLCLECHSPLGGDTLGSQPPSLHDLRSPRYRNCTVCHVAVHGSQSSPALLK